MLAGTERVLPRDMSASAFDPRLAAARRSVRDSRPPPRTHEATSAYLDEGLEALGAADHARALACFDAVAAQAPDNPRFQAYRAWARYAGIAAAELNVPTAERGWLVAQRKANAREIIDKATRRLPRFDSGYCFLARIDLDAGDLDRAESLAKRALVLNPELEEAQRVLDRVQQRRTPERPTGEFGRFGKWLSGKRVPADNR